MDFVPIMPFTQQAFHLFYFYLNYFWYLRISNQVPAWCCLYKYCVYKSMQRCWFCSVLTWRKNFPLWFLRICFMLMLKLSQKCGQKYGVQKKDIMRWVGYIGIKRYVGWGCCPEGGFKLYTYFCLMLYGSVC